MWQYAPSEEHSKVELDNGVRVDVLKMTELIQVKNDLIKGRNKSIGYKEVAKPAETKTKKK